MDWYSWPICGVDWFIFDFINGWIGWLVDFVSFWLHFWLCRWYGWVTRSTCFNRNWLVWWVSKYCILLLVWLISSTVCCYWYGWFEVLYAIIGMVGFKYCMLISWSALFFQVLQLWSSCGQAVCHRCCAESLVSGSSHLPHACRGLFPWVMSIKADYMCVGVCVCGCDCSTELIIWENISPLL